MSDHITCPNSLAYELGGVPRPGTAQSVADALAGVNHAQGTPGTFGLGPAHELAALRDLAEAVRAQPVTPVPGVTTHDGYVVRHVVTTAGRHTAWFVAAQGGPGFDQRWSTWRAESFGPGPLDWSVVNYHDGPAGPDGLDNRANALRDLADRAGLTL